MVITEPQALNPKAADYAIFAAQSLVFSGGMWFPPLKEGQPSRVILRRNIRDVDRDKSRSLMHSYLYTDNGRWLQGSTLPLELTGVTAVAPSPSGKYMLLFKEEAKEGAAASPDGDNGKKIVVEVWGSSSLVRAISLAGVHGRVLGDSWFGSFSWSKDETCLAYVAESKANKAESAFSSGDTLSGGANTPTATFGKFEYREDWGEKYEGYASLSLFVLSIKTGRITKVPNVGPNITPGQPVFSPDERFLLYVGWPDLPRKLGMIYCYQRPSSLYATDVSDILAALNTDEAGPTFITDATSLARRPHVCLTPRERIARSPVFSRAGTQLAYLGSFEGFETHNGPISLRILNWSKFLGGVEEIDCFTAVDSVTTPSAGMFPGLWLDNLPRECWSMDDSSIFLTSAWGSKSALLQVQLIPGGGHSHIHVVGEAGEAAAIGFEGQADNFDCRDASVSLFAVTPHGLLICGSAPNSPGGFGMLAPSPQGNGFVFVPGPMMDSSSVSTSQVPLARYRTLKSALDQVRWRILTIQPSDNGPTYEAILILPYQDPSAPLPPMVVVPHGGPHAVTISAYFHSYAFLCVSYGLALLHVNYRGSTGFGSAALASLAGHIGAQDVRDVFDATQLVRSQVPAVVDSNRVGIVGGSHGGFLAAHLIGQYPDMFKAAALRNPVTNIAGMVSATDIPDWCYTEALGKGSFDFATFQPPTADQLTRMWAASPVAHIHKVQAPTLIALGAKDRRVPFSQGLEYHHALRARGIRSKLLIYPQDVHAIDRPASEADHWIEIGEWLREYLNQ